MNIPYVNIETDEEFSYINYGQCRLQGTYIQYGFANPKNYYKTYSSTHWITII